jgi:hypothetical protein
MPDISLPNTVYLRLQEHAVPFADTPATVIVRLLDAYEKNEPKRISKVKGSIPTQPPQQGKSVSTNPNLHLNAKQARQERSWEVISGGTAIPCFTRPHPKKPGEFIEVTIYGFRLTGILLALRDADYSHPQVRQLMKELNLEDVRDTTIRNYLNINRKGRKAILATEQLAAFNRLAGLKK